MTNHNSRRTTTRDSARPARRLLLLAALLVALAIAGCSSQSTGSGSATSTGASDQAVAFSQCMRDNGIKEFPDPDASGELTIDALANRTSIDTRSAAFEQALTACRDLQPAGFTGTTRSDEQQAGALGFAQCIRDNGVTDFPDPGPDDPMIDTTKIPSANRPGGMDKLHAAMSKCSDEARDAGVQR